MYLGSKVWRASRQEQTDNEPEQPKYRAKDFNDENLDESVM